jgi:hypothetical protein
MKCISSQMLDKPEKQSKIYNSRLLGCDLVSLTGWFSTIRRNVTPSSLRATKSNRNNQRGRNPSRPSTNRYQYVRTYVLPHVSLVLDRFTREYEGTTLFRNVDSHLLNDTFTSQKTCIFSNIAAIPSHVSRSNFTCVISFCLPGLLFCDTV